MKKLSLISFFVFFLAAGMLAQVTFGPRVGLNISKYGYNFKDAGMEPDVKFRLGGSVGAVMNLQINNFLAFQPSLSFTKKGTALDLGSNESGEAILTGYNRARVAYLELPLNLAIGIRLGPGQAQFFAGPYLAMAICGKQRWDYEENVNGVRTQIDGDKKIIFGNEAEEDMTGSTEDIYQRRFDYGIDFGFGYRYKQLLFNFGFAMGLANLQPESPGEDSFSKDHKYFNRTIFLNAAWLFGKGSKGE